MIMSTLYLLMFKGCSTCDTTRGNKNLYCCKKKYLMTELEKIHINEWQNVMSESKDLYVLLYYFEIVGQNRYIPNRYIQNKVGSSVHW